MNEHVEVEEEGRKMEEEEEEVESLSMPVPQGRGKCSSWLRAWASSTPMLGADPRHKRQEHSERKVLSLFSGCSCMQRSSQRSTRLVGAGFV